MCHGVKMAGLPQAEQTTALGFSANSVLFIAQWDAETLAQYTGCTQNNVAGRKMLSSSAQALESNSKATATLASHRHKEGVIPFKALFYLCRECKETLIKIASSFSLAGAEQIVSAVLPVFAMKKANQH